MTAALATTPEPVSALVPTRRATERTALTTATGVAAYLRVSHAVEDGRTFDEQQESQRQAIARLAERRGGGPPAVEYIDWDRSADPAKEHQRTGLTAMLRAIDAGEVKVVYASSLDRLYRSIQTFTRITETCKAHNVPIYTDREGPLAGDGSPMAQAFAEITAVFSGLELNTAKARARSRVARQRAAGIRLGEFPFGGKPGEDLQAVLDAFEAEGSYQGAARKLNAAGVRPRRGRQWESTTVRRIIRHSQGLSNLRPDPNGRRGQRARAVHAFSGLVACPHDGTTLTASFRNVRGRREVGLFCRVGRQNRSHPRPWSVPEHLVRTWTQVQTAGVLGPPEPVTRVYIPEDGPITFEGGHVDEDGRVVPDSIRPSPELAAGYERRDRLLAAMREAGVPAATFEPVLAPIEADIARLRRALKASGEMWGMPINWDLSGADLNARLRGILHHIVLGSEMRPVGVVWRSRPFLQDESGVWVFDDDTGERIGDYHPRAVAVSGGWLLLDEAAL